MLTTRGFSNSSSKQKNDHEIWHANVTRSQSRTHCQIWKSSNIWTVQVLTVNNSHSTNITNFLHVTKRRLFVFLVLNNAIRRKGIKILLKTKTFIWTEKSLTLASFCFKLQKYIIFTILSSLKLTKVIRTQRLQPDISYCTEVKNCLRLCILTSTLRKCTPTPSFNSVENTEVIELV